MQNDGDFVDVILVYILNLSANFVSSDLKFPDGFAGTVWERPQLYHFVFSVTGQGP